MRGNKENESFGLRHELSSGVVPEIQEEDISARGSEGTSEAIDQGDQRRVSIRNNRAGNIRRTYSYHAVVSTLAIDWGSGQNHKEQ